MPASQVGKRIKVRVERVLDGRAYAVAIRKAKDAPEPLTAEGEAEKPTRKPPARKGAAAVAIEETEPVAEAVTAEEPEAETDGEADETSEAEEAPKPKKKTRRGSRGGKRRKKAPATAETAETAETEAGDAAEEAPEPTRGVTIHVPGDELGRDGKAEPAEEAPAEPEPQATEEPTTAEAAEAEAPKPKKKTRRGSRGGKNRKKKPAVATQNGAEAAPGTEPAPEAEPASENGDFEYVPMSEWVDELESKG
jgi:ribonuclease E